MKTTLSVKTMDESRTARSDSGMASFLSRELRHFAEDEDGAMLIFSLAILVAMLMISGMAVDLAIVEDHRVRMQQTADRAVLAAADLDQPRDAKLVVEDYFAKAGLADAVPVVTVTPGLNFRRVEANVTNRVDTIFMHMLGIDYFNTPARSVAEEKISDIEISLVLDVSGSMQGSRLSNLKSAAKNFFDAVIDEQSTQGVTTVSIIPYNHVVNAGPDLLARMAVDEEHTESHCIRFRDDDFTTMAMDPTNELERVAHFDFWTNNYKKPKDYQYWCKDDDNYEILVHEPSIATLDSYIHGLQAGGATAIDNGMKWAVGLLDPAIGPAITGMIADGKVSNKAAARPAPYEDEDNMKIIVLMTDGENTEQRDIADNYKTGMSDVYMRGSGSNRNDWYVHLPGNPSSKRYYQPRNPKKTSDDRWMENLPSDAVRQSNQDLYTRFAIDDVAKYFWKYSDYQKAWRWGIYPQEYHNRYNNVMNKHDQYSEIDNRFKALCDKVKAEEHSVQVFAIGFEAPTHAETVLKYCATTDAHFYDIDGTDINVAFQSIANTINRLRLTQ